jgi:hypothetical protein
MFIVREGKRRRRGAYLTVGALYDGLSFYHYSKKQHRAKRFSSSEEAKEAAKQVLHVEKYRVVRFKERPIVKEC